MEKKILDGKFGKDKKKKKFLIIGSGHKLSLERSYIRAFKNLKIKNIDYIFLDNGFFFSLLNKYKYFFLDNLYSYICSKKKFIQF